MTQITASLVKDLREKTGAGMMDCKKALIETSGEVEPAIDWLRKKGLAAAAKKAGRVASEGLIGFSAGEGRAAVVEVNAETDFVSRNEQFQAFVRAVARLALETGDDVESIKKQTVASGPTVEDELTHLIATIGENMSLRRAAVVSVEHGCVASYMHASQASGLGRIGVLVGLGGVDPSPALEALGKQLAMHVAAANPQAIARANVDPKALERERNILSEQALASGKPPQIVEKMVEGRLSKYFEEVCLLEQAFVIDPERRVGKVLEAAGKDLGGPITVTGFVRFALGEGIEKKEEDFAAEVAKAAGE
ncbi:MAG TPA: translation elongation factor Ts [Rhodospirillales bacterium]|nr:translation elongation factor Ts [Rhodospirillales bacterium]